MWMQLGALGERATAAAMARTTFYRNRKLLVEAGCAWEGSDVQIVPVEPGRGRAFRPSLSSPLRVVEKLPRVADIEARYGGVAA